MQLDFSFLKNRLTATVDIYNQTLSDQVMGFFDDGEIGISGLEILLGYQLFKNKKLEWRSNLSFSTYKTTVYSYGAEPEPIDLGFVRFPVDYREIQLEHFHTFKC